ncbi:MAG: MarR family transcriptional regulator [Pseudomonadota bacterium]
MEKFTHTTLVKQLWFSSNALYRRLDLSLGTIHGIGFTEYMVLDALSEAPNGLLRRVDLAAAIGRTASGVTRLLAPMEKIGLIEKAQNNRDARVSMVKLTEAGKRIWRDATTSLQQNTKNMFYEADEKRLNDLLTFLQKTGGR